jgi:hypothetical protein
LKKAITLSMLVTLPVGLSGCGEYIEQQITAEEECLIEEQDLMIDLDCEDEDSDWYKKKGYKSKAAITKIYKSSSGSGKSGFGGGYSSGG